MHTDLELRDYLDVARRWAWLLILATAVGAVGAWAGTRLMARTYASSTTLMVGRGIDNPDVSTQTIYLSEQLATTYSQMATREPVLSGVVAALGLETDWRSLTGMVRGVPQPGTPLFEIRVVATDPQLSKDIAAAAAEALINQSPTEQQRQAMQDDAFIAAQLAGLRENIDGVEAEIDTLKRQVDLETSARGISEVESRLEAKMEQRDRWQQRYAELRTSREGGEVNALSVIEPATPGIQVGPNVRMNVLLAALIGLGIALAAVVVIEYLDDTVKTTEEVERRLGVTGLGTVDRFDHGPDRSDSLIALQQPRSPVAESYRTMRTNLQFALLQRPGRRLVVTSANPGEGKSTTAANLAVVMAQSGRHVVLVDADLRKPSLHRFFGCGNAAGLTTQLLDPAAALDAVLRPVDGLPNLRLVTSGPLPPNPAEVLGSAEMRRLLGALEERADVVVVDSPPVLLVTDAALLSIDAAGTLMVLDSGVTRTDAARKALESLRKAGVAPLGAVVNKLDRSRAGGYYRYGYAYGRGAYAAYYGEDAEADAPDGGVAAPRRPSQRPQWLQRVADGVNALLG